MNPTELETARLHASATATDDADRQRLIFDSVAGVVIIATDFEGRVTDWNRGAENVFGWSADEVRG